jgi:hypothetical protein
MKKIILIGVLAFCANAFAAQEYGAAQPCGDVAAIELRDEAQRAYDQDIKDLRDLEDKLRNMPSASNPLGGAFSCLDRLKNFQITVGLGIPNIWDLVLKQLSNMVCGAVNGVMNDATAAINKSVSYPGIKGLPGSAGNSGIYVGGNGGVNINGQPVATPSYNSATKVYQSAVINQPIAPPVQPTQPPTLLDRVKQGIKNVF